MTPLVSMLVAAALTPAPDTQPPAALEPPRAATAITTASTNISIGSLRATLPAGWIEEKPSSSMRKAQLRLPHAAGDSEDASLTVFYFGAQAGTVEANLDRWLGMMEQPDGRSSREVAKIEKRDVAGMKLTVLDVAGRYRADAMPGGGEKLDKPDWRMIAAVVEAADGAYYVKVLGPAKTMAAQQKAVTAFVDSLRPAGSAR